MVSKDEFQERLRKTKRKMSDGRRPPRKPAGRPASRAARNKKSKLQRAAEDAKRAARSRRSAMRKRRPPAARAQARKEKNEQRPMPKPPVRRPIKRTNRGAALAVGAAGAAAVGAGAVNQGMAAKIDLIEEKFERLEGSAQLGGVYTTIGSIDTKLTEMPLRLEKLRRRGYVHSGQLEDMLEALDDQWDEIRPRVETALQEQVERLDKELDLTERRVSRLNARDSAAVTSTENDVDGLGSRISAAERAVSGLYDGIETQLDRIDYKMDKVEAMFDLLDHSQEIKLREAEGPLVVVKAEWEQDGEEGPDGYLFLTDQRLLFEQREEVVTKKRFGIFKADSEMVQKLLVEVEVHQVDSISHKEEGGFLGMGKDDILELVFDATAPLSRARFHLDGQDSSDWAAMIKRVQNGDIDEDRSEDYADELEEAGIVSASFPTQCPLCFAAVPEQPRGVTSYTCEFCGAVVNPETPTE